MLKIPNAVASIRHYYLSLKRMAWKHTTYHLNNSNPGHTRLKQQLEKILKIIFASASKNAVEKNEEKKIMAIAEHFMLYANAVKLKKQVQCWKHAIVFHCFYTSANLANSAFARYSLQKTLSTYDTLLKFIFGIILTIGSFLSWWTKFKITDAIFCNELPLYLNAFVA